MARVREHKYLITINKFIVNLLSTVLIIALIFFSYKFIIDYITIDIEAIKLTLLNAFGENIISFMLYGLRYVVLVLCIFIIYELFRGIILGLKDVSMIFRIEKGDIYSKCINEVSNKRVIISYLIPYILLAALPYAIGIYLRNIYILLIGLMMLIFNIRDIIMVFILLFMSGKKYKYIDYKDVNNFVIKVRREYDNYKNIFIKSIKCIDDEKIDYENNILVISKWSLCIFIVLIIGTIVGGIL